MKRKKDKNLNIRGEELYKDVPTNNLILFGVCSVMSEREKCTFEKLVEKCFSLFPKAFGFTRHPEWPDSLKFDRQLRTLREKGLIAGSPRTSFTLTKFGEEIAEKTAKVLRIRFPKKAVVEKAGRDAEINWIFNLKGSEIFQRFLKEKSRFSITDMELRNLLYCTLEAPLRIVKQNLVYSRNLAEEFKEKELLDFLELCQQKLGGK